MIPVPIKQLPNSSYPLNVEDTDIPFIEDESRQSNSKSIILPLYYNTYTNCCIQLIYH